MTLQNAFGNLALDDTLTDGSQVTQIAGTVPLPTGAATAARQDTGNTSLAAIDTKLAGTLAVSASSLPLPSGAATAAKQPALGTAGTPAADVISVQGVASMTALKVDGSAVTQPVSDGGGSLTIDGTVTANAGSGTFAVSAAALPLPSGASTESKQDTGNTSLAAIDAKLGGTLAVSATTLPLPSGAATSAKQPALGSAGSASSDVLTVQGIASMTALKVDGSAVTQPVSGSITANAGTNLNTSALALESGGNLAAIKAKTDNIPASPATDRSTAAAPSSARLSDGTAFYDAAKSSQLPTSLVSGRLDVNIGAGSVAATSAGDVAHDAVDNGNPVKQGAKATTALQSITTVADADRTHLYAGVDGVLITREHSNLESMASGTMSNTDGASTVMTGFAAAGAGVKWYITDVIMSNSSGTNITVDLRDGTAGSVKATFPVPANGGVVHRFAVPVAFTANTAVAIDASAAATTLNVTLCGFKSKV